MMKLATISFLLAMVALVVAMTTSMDPPLQIGRVLMLFAVLLTLVSFTFKLIEDTESHTLRYRR